jgi:hypothetical protein
MKFSSLALLVSTLLILLPEARSAPPAAKEEKPAAKKEGPVAKPDAGGAKELVLFNGGDSIDDWETRDAGGSGTVELQDDFMWIGTGESITGAVYKKKDLLPVMNYEITLEAQRLQGLDFFCGLTFPVGDLKTCVTLVLGGWGGSVTGISSIDGMDASENSTGHYRRYDDKKWYRVKVRVTAKNISVWSNDEKIVDLDTEGKKLGVRPGPIEDYQPFSLTTFQTTAAVRNVKVKTLSAEGAK